MDLILYADVFMLMKCLKVCGWKLGSISSKPVFDVPVGKRYRHVDAKCMVRNILIAVDPDTRGAIVTAAWEGEDALTCATQNDSVSIVYDCTPASVGSSAAVDIAAVSLKVYDMPCAR